MSKPLGFHWTEEQLAKELRAAIKAYWRNRGGQSARQTRKGVKDAGTRAEVTGGKHLNQVLLLICKVAVAAGFNEEEIFLNIGVELPGYFRPQKRWDVVITRNERLCAAVELKSQVGSFGNNFNNRSEEAIGCSTDFWTAFREGALGARAPWLGYLFLLEKADKSTRPVSLKTGPFPPFEVFRGTSYAQRYAILCERLVLERKYSSTSLILAPKGKLGEYEEPDRRLSFYAFAKSLHGHLIGSA